MTFYAEQYVKKLFGIHRVEDALQRLDKFTQEEARMAAAETLTIAHRIDVNVESVGNEVGLINKGLSFLYPTDPRTRSQPGSVRCNRSHSGDTTCV